MHNIIIVAIPRYYNEGNGRKKSVEDGSGMGITTNLGCCWLASVINRLLFNLIIHSGGADNEGDKLDFLEVALLLNN